MAKNQGKRFEEDWKNSIPDKIFFYRFRDGTANFAGTKNENVRFQQKNMCDCLLYDSENLFLLELKSTKGKSIPFGNIRQNQLDELVRVSDFSGVYSGFVFNFRDVEKTYFLDANTTFDYIMTADRKSFPIDFVDSKGIQIKQTLLRTRYRYDTLKFISDIKAYI